MDSLDNSSSRTNPTGPIGTKILFENEKVRAWDLTLAPGESTEWHQHELDYVFIVTEAGPVYTEYVDGAIERQNHTVGHVEMRPVDQPHRLVNDGTSRYRNVVLELKCSGE